jgi:hypothetical protein
MNAPSFQLALKLALTLSIVRHDADLDAGNRPYSYVVASLLRVELSLHYSYRLSTPYGVPLSTRNTGILLQH